MKETDIHVIGISVGVGFVDADEDEQTGADLRHHAALHLRYRWDGGVRQRWKGLKGSIAHANLDAGREDSLHDGPHRSASAATRGCLLYGIALGYATVQAVGYPFSAKQTGPCGLPCVANERRLASSIQTSCALRDEIKPDGSTESRSTRSACSKSESASEKEKSIFFFFFFHYHEHVI